MQAFTKVKLPPAVGGSFTCGPGGGADQWGLAGPQTGPQPGDNLRYQAIGVAAAAAATILGR
eukprot:scaffold672833_cov84-Prasinocladus_malaysianus.AAC.1